MQPNIEQLLAADRRTSQFFELLGRPLFDPDIEGILASIRTLMREAMSRQDHADPVVAARAIALVRELGRAELTFGRPSRLAEYSGEIAVKLRTRLDSLDPQWTGWSIARLHDWLRREAQVHAAQLDFAAQRLRASLSSAALEAGSPPQHDRVFGAESLQQLVTSPPTDIGPAPSPRAGSEGLGEGPGARIPIAAPSPSSPDGEILSIDLVGERSTRRVLTAVGVVVASAVVVLLSTAVWLRSRDAPAHSPAAPPASASASASPRVVEGQSAREFVARVNSPQSPVRKPTVPSKNPSTAANESQTNKAPPVTTPSPTAALPPVVAPRPQPAPAVGENAEFVGSLELVWGNHVDGRLELHLAIELDVPYEGGRYVEAVTHDAGVHRDLLDYVTWDDLRYDKSESAPKHASHVRLRGKRVEPKQAATFRLTCSQDDILLEFESLERLDEPNSRVVAATERPPGSFALAPERRALIGLLRAPLQTGGSVVVRGNFRGYLDEPACALISPWASEFGAEIVCAKSEVAELAPGAEVELTVRPSGEARRLLIGQFTKYRPIVKGSAIRAVGPSTPAATTASRSEPPVAQAPNAAQSTPADAPPSAPAATGTVREDDYDSVDLPALALSAEPVPLVVDYCSPSQATGLHLELGVAGELLPHGMVYRLEADASDGDYRRWNVIATHDNIPKGAIAQFQLRDGSLDFRWLSTESPSHSLRNTVLFASPEGVVRPLVLRRLARSAPISIDTLGGASEVVLYERLENLRWEGLRWQLLGLTGFPSSVDAPLGVFDGVKPIVLDYNPGEIQLQWRMSLARQKSELKFRYAMVGVEGKKTKTVTASIIRRENQEIAAQTAAAMKSQEETSTAKSALERERPLLGNDQARINEFNRRVEEYNARLRELLPAIDALNRRGAIYRQVVSTVDVMQGRSAVKLRVFFRCRGREFDLVRAE